MLGVLARNAAASPFFNWREKPQFRARRRAAHIRAMTAYAEGQCALAGRPFPAVSASRGAGPRGKLQIWKGVDQMAQRRGKLRRMSRIAPTKRRPDVINQHLADLFRSVPLMEKILAENRGCNFRNMFMLGYSGNFSFRQATKRDAVLQGNHSAHCCCFRIQCHHRTFWSMQLFQGNYFRLSCIDL